MNPLLQFFHNLFNFKGHDQLVKALAQAQALLRENETLQARIKEESTARTTAATAAVKYQSLAEEWQTRYTSAVDAHISTLKSESNWFAMSTSTRLPMHDGIGPTRPVSRDEAPSAIPITPKRLSTIAKEETRRTLDNAAEIQREMLARLSKDATALEPVNLDLTEDAAKLYHDQYGEWPPWYSLTAAVGGANATG